MAGSRFSRRRLFLGLGGLILVALAIALPVFKPWLLLVNTRVDDEIPQVAAAGQAPATGESAGSATGSPAAGAEGPELVARGTFISHEHTTTGEASIVRGSDGSHQLVLSNLETSNGPDVRVWLSAGPVVEGAAGWTTAGDHEHLEVAPLKGNRGNQVYNLPADFDPAAWPSVDLWCEDFSVSFGAAALSPAG